MNFSYLKRLFIFLLLPTIFCKAQPANEQHIQVALRLIGDKLLLSSGDSTSRVLPINKEVNQYKIQFENDFEINTENLIDIVQETVDKEQIAKSYFIEVKTCDSNLTVYSFEKKPLNENNLLPCKTRPLPKSCYFLFFTIIDDEKIHNDKTTKSSTQQLLNYIFLIFIFLISIILYIYKRKKRVKTNYITIGKYLFDPKGMKLNFQKKSLDLSGKETELLLLFYFNIDKTIERDKILKEVWGDEGDYIGRTLDVFVSKLRKKLKEDSSIEIINIRGIGYRFVIN